MQEIAPNIFIETDYAFVTIGAVRTKAGWVCIDTPPYPRDARAWLANLMDIDPKPVQYVINTDQHRDRILGNYWFSAPVVAHEAAARYVLQLKGAFVSQAADEMSSNDNELIEIAGVRLVPPQIAYSDSLYLSGGGREIKLINKPSASRGSSWVLFPEEKVIFVGDTMVAGEHPYINDGATGEWLDRLRELRSRYAGWKIIAGRQQIDDIAESETLSEYLRTARRKVMNLQRSDSPRTDVANIVPEMIDLYPYEPVHREIVYRRIKSGLESIYDELQQEQLEEASSQQG
jgi:cyclase